MLSYKDCKEKLEKYFMRHSQVVGADLVGDSVVVRKKCRLPNAEKDTSSTHLYQITADGQLKSTNVIVQESASVAMGYSHDSKKQAVIKELADNHFALEVFDKGIMVMRREFKDKFSGVCTSSYLASQPIVWNAEGTKFLFLVERKKDYELPAGKDFDEKILTKFDYQHNFGEMHAKFYNLEIIIVNLELQQVARVIGFSDEYAVTQASFVGSDGNSIVFQGIDSKQFISGVAFCNNKLSSIYIADSLALEVIKDKAPESAQSSEEKQTETLKPVTAVRKLSKEPIALMPFASPCGQHICYFYAHEYKEHHKFTLGLMTCAKDGSSSRVIVCSKEENLPELALYVDCEFYGSLIWLNEDKFGFEASERASSVFKLVDFKSGAIKTIKLSHKFSTESVSVLATSPKHLILSQNSIEISGRVGILTNWAEDNRALHWEPKDSTVEGEVEEVIITHKDVPGNLWRVKDWKDASGQVVSVSQRPLHVALHGGPHSAYSSINSPFHSILLEQGFQILTVNFSGSWGFGKDFNERLAGKIGELDVDEVLYFLDQLKGQFDSTRLYFEGGSYSGYLAFVFLQKHPHLFTAMVSRNPGVNRLFHYFSSDCPEWNTVECLGSLQAFSYTKDLTDDELLRMRDISPALLPYDSTTKTRVLLILGAADRRIPPAGSYFLYRKLKSLGLDIRCSVYPGEGHRITKTKHVFDSLLNSLHTILGFK